MRKKHTAKNEPHIKAIGSDSVAKCIRRDIWLYVFLAPAIIYLIVFKYAPMLGMVIGFKDYSIGKGILGSEWVGFDNFIRLFKTPNFFTILRNTIGLNVLNLVFGFPAPIILSILINEVNCKAYKRTVQTILYVPHFVSWVILGGIIIQLTSINGPISVGLSKLFGMAPKSFISDPASWIVIYIISGIWQSVGWGTIIYLAAITNVDSQLYEAARIDGANKFQQIINVTLPCISSTVVTMLILRMGSMLSVGFEQIYMLQNSAVFDVSDVISTYEYRVGLEQRQYSLTTALGFFKGVVGLILVFGTNTIAKKLGEGGLW
ncbi:MAG: ABC transporter permease subunit [Oscillospiraceae bacterium]|nr:ABC transporter permease subunit [Oscillospiraceae bacterium]